MAVLISRGFCVPGEAKAGAGWKALALLLLCAREPRLGRARRPLRCGLFVLPQLGTSGQLMATCGKTEGFVGLHCSAHTQGACGTELWEPKRETRGERLEKIEFPPFCLYSSVEMTKINGTKQSPIPTASSVWEKRHYFISVLAAWRITSLSSHMHTHMFVSMELRHIPYFAQTHRSNIPTKYLTYLNHFLNIMDIESRNLLRVSGAHIVNIPFLKFSSCGQEV